MSDIAPKPLVQRLQEAAISQRKAAYLPRHVDVADLLEEAVREIEDKEKRYDALASHHNVKCTCLEIY